jgi:hypothetical protein
MEQDLELDAVLVHASIRGLWAQAAIYFGMTVGEAHARAEWLKVQPQAYISKVSDRVQELECVSTAQEK